MVYLFQYITSFPWHFDQAEYGGSGVLAYLFKHGVISPTVSQMVECITKSSLGLLKLFFFPPSSFLIQLDRPSKKTEEKQNVDSKLQAADTANSYEKEAQKQTSGDKKEAEEKKSKEKRDQRV